MVGYFWVQVRINFGDHNSIRGEIKSTRMFWKNVNPNGQKIVLEKIRFRFTEFFRTEKKTRFNVTPGQDSGRIEMVSKEKMACRYGFWRDRQSGHEKRYGIDT